MKRPTPRRVLLATLALAFTTAPYMLSAQEATMTTAIRTTDFLDSLGIDTTFPDRGQPLDRTVEMIRYVGFRWVRGGIEGLTTNGPTTVQTYLDLHRQTGVRFSWGLVSSARI